MRAGKYGRGPRREVDVDERDADVHGVGRQARRHIVGVPNEEVRVDAMDVLRIRARIRDDDREAVELALIAEPATKASATAVAGSGRLPSRGVVCAAAAGARAGAGGLDVSSG